jgi:molybdopterin synthase catalytic subunit
MKKTRLPSIPLLPGDEVASMITLTREPIDLVACIQAEQNHRIGGIVSFLGVVRDDDILSIEMESYEEAAMQELERIKDEAESVFRIESVDIIHRIGTLRVGDPIVLIVVGAAHRKEAFRACEYIIDRIKETVPIWKKEETKHGSRWVPGEHP